MPNRIEFSTFVDGAGFKRGMAEMEAAANATNLRLQNMLRSKISAVESRMGGMDPNSWEYVQANQRRMTLEKSLLNVQNAMYLRGAQDRIAIAKKEADDEKMIWIRGQAEWRGIQATQTAEMLANFEKQRVAAELLKAEQLAMLTTVARGYGAGVSSGAHGGGGGIAGIIRESLVIVREISMGRGIGRVAGSVTLLAQYLGLLGKLVKSTAADALVAAAAESKLSQSMAMAAISAEAKAAASAQAAAAETVDTAATQRLAAADLESAVAARSAAVAQEAKAVASTSAAEMALASATVAIGPIGWLVAGIVALVAVVGGLIWHWHKASVEAKNLADLMNPLKHHYTDEAQAAREAAKAHDELQNWLSKELTDRKSLIEITDIQLRQLKEEAEAQRELARAKGESMSQINAMEVQELKNEQALVQAAEDQAAADLEIGKSRLSAWGATAAPTTDTGENLKDAQGAAKRAGEVLDAVEDQFQDGPLDALQIAKTKFGGNVNVKGKLGSSSNMTEAGLNGVTGDMTIDQAIAKLTAGLMAQTRDVKIGNNAHTISGNDAKAILEAANKTVQGLQDATDARAKHIEDAKGDISAANEAHKKYQQRLAEIAGELKIKTGIGAQTASFEDAKKFAKSSRDDSLVRVGNFLGSARSGIENLAAEHVKIARQSLHQLEIINMKLSGNSSSASFTGV